MLASAATGAAACGARTGDELDGPYELLVAQAAGRAGSARGGAPQAGAAGAAQGGAAQAGSAGEAGAAGAPIIPGCAPGSTCIADSWCQIKSNLDICECASGAFTCGKAFPWGETTKVCFDQPASGCPSIGTGELNKAMPWALGCSGVSSGPVVELLGGNAAFPSCCYQIGNFACGGRPLVISELGWTAGLVARTDWV